VELGDIYVVSLDPTMGHEQQGTRPVLVVTKSQFNRATGMPLIVPITTVGNFARTAGYAVTLMGAGTATTGVARCDQLKALDLRARKAKFIERAPQFVIDEVLARISSLFDE
jgi:mRNA interferase ChpB